MNVKELIEVLKNVDPDAKACIYYHGRDVDQEIIGLFEEEDYDDNDNLVGTHVAFYEY